MNKNVEVEEDPILSKYTRPQKEIEEEKKKEQIEIEKRKLRQQ